MRRKLGGHGQGRGQQQGRAQHRRRRPAQPPHHRQPTASLLQGLQQANQGETSGTREHEAGQQRGLGPELEGRRAQEKHRQDRDDRAEHEPADLSFGHSARVGDHEEREDQNLGRRDQDLP